MDTIILLGGLENNSPYKKFIEGAAAKAESVIGLVAYWTVGIELIPNLIKLNENPNSFICVDPSSPTDLFLLLSLNKAGNNFYAFNYEVSGYETREGLLHSKVLLFDNSDDSAVLILGSHNMSVRALTGINIEHSIYMRLKKTDHLYLDIKSQIIAIKEKHCSKIESVNKIDEDEKEIYVLTIVGDRMDTLVNEQIISVFYKNQNEAIKTNEQKLLVMAIEADTGEKFLYSALIKQSGSLDRFIEKSTEIEFSKRRYAEKDSLMIPFLFSERDVSLEVNKSHKYFNTIQFIEKIQDYKLYSYHTVDVSSGVKDLYNTDDKTFLDKIKASPRLNNQRRVSDYNTNFNASKIKEYYSGDNTTLFPDQVRTPNFENYPKHKNIREKMFFRKK
jgi:hypothetical protein